LIAYKILSTVPFDIEESTVGTGALCGSTRLNEGFETLLRNKLRRNATKILTPERLVEPIDSFDTVLKRQFNPYDKDCEDEYQIRFSGPSPPDIPEVGLEAGYMKLTKYLSRPDLIVEPRYTVFSYPSSAKFKLLSTVR
jgi:hypothetical protein